jgi:hypothetical protein
VCEAVLNDKTGRAAQTHRNCAYQSARSRLLPDMNAFAPRRGTEPQISEAITLGWRLATLYSLRADELPSSPPDNLLPMRRSLPAAERLVLELRAAAGDAGRLGIGPSAAEIEELVELARQAPESDDAEERLRAHLRAWHIELQTKLWADHEATGKAYELGSFLSDTSNRVVLELRRPGDPCPHVTRELREVFSPSRVERVKRLLDDLQARIDPAAVRIVKQHLEFWQAAVGERAAQCATRADLEPLDHQVVTWFQLVSGDKEPEAYIDHDDRVGVRGTMVSRTLRSYAANGRFVVGTVLALGVLAALVAFVPNLADKVGTSELLAFAGTVATALGVSFASIGRTVRKSLDARAELLWNTALVEVISHKTLRVDEMLPLAQAGHAWLPSSATPRLATLRAARRTA